MPKFVIIILRDKLTIKIKEIAAIRTGFFGKPVKNGEVVYLQAKQFNENAQLDADLYPDLLLSDVPEKHILQVGEIVFAAKGLKNFAAVFNRADIKAVASTSFFVIKIKEGLLLPEYICWYINLPTTQAFLKAQAMGSSVPSIAKHVLEDLVIPAPNLQKQKNIIQINELLIREKKLLREIALLRQQKIETQLTKALSKL